MINDIFTKTATDFYNDEFLNNIYESNEDLVEWAKAAPADEEGARELHMYASNHADLHRQRIMPIISNLDKKHKKKVYDHEKAKKLWGYAADDAAKKYEKEHGGKFSPATRKIVASKMADEHRTEHGWGSVKEETELNEGIIKKEVVRSLERPKGIGWTLKQAKEQTGKPYNVWERTYKSVPNTNYKLKEEVEQLDESELIEKVTDNGDGTETVVTKSIGKDGIPSTSTVRRRKEGNPMDPSDLKMLKTARMSHGTHHGEVKEALADWAQKEFDSAFPKKTKAVNVDSDDWSPKMTAAEKEGGKRQQQINKRMELLKQVTRTVKRANHTYDPDAHDEDKAIENNSTIKAGADHPWIPKPTAPKTAAAKTVSQGVTGQKAGKAPSDARAAALQARLARLPKNHPDVAKIKKMLGEVYDPITKAQVARKPIKQQAGGPVTNNGKPVEPGLSKHWQEKMKKEEVEQVDEAQTEFYANNEMRKGASDLVHTPKKTKIVVKSQGKTIRSYDDPAKFKANQAMHKAAGHSVHRVVEDFIVVTAKEGMSYRSAVLFENEVIFVGKAMTESAVDTLADEFIDGIYEEIIQEQVTKENAIQIAKKFAADK